MNTEIGFESYINTALWSSLDEDDRYLDEYWTICDISKETLKLMEDAYTTFYHKAWHLVKSSDKNATVEHFGHNVWLTQNGHGAGFWDGDYANGEELTALCKELGEVHLYRGDDGKIYT